jgi:hypothetical protein
MASKKGPAHIWAENTHAIGQVPLLLSLVRYLLHLSLFSLTWPPEGQRRSWDYTTAARHHAVEFPNPVRSHLLPQSQLDLGLRGSYWSSYVCEYTEVPPLVAPESLCQVRHDLEVGYISYIINACVGALSPHSVRYVTEALIVTVLLVDRSWAFHGCVDSNFFVISIKTQHWGH